MIKMHKVRLSIIGVLLLNSVFSFANSKSNEKAVYYYETETTALEGRLTLETFPGPPEYSSIREGDKPESYWVLKLDVPIEIASNTGNDGEGLHPIEKEVRALQLTMDFDKVTPKKLGFKNGVKFRIVGTLFHRSTIHQVSRVLIWVKNGSPLK